MKALLLSQVRTISVTGRVLQQLGSGTGALVIQNRGGKTKYGGITRDPLIHMKQKLSKQKQRKHAKIPLVSEERKQSMITLPVNTTSLNQFISTYIPLEASSKAPLFSNVGLQQRWIAFKSGLGILYSGAMIRRSLRKIEPFHPKAFARNAQEQFVMANEAIKKKDKFLLRKLTTENASESLKKEFEHKHFDWELVEEIERPRVVSASVAPFQTKKNLFAQVVVRLHTRQILALYDSANRVVRGHPTRSKPVIDYVVLERNLSSNESSWRIAGKLPPQQPWEKALNSKGDKPDQLAAA